MYNSRNIDDLRPDVAANCRKWMQLCEDRGLKVLVTGTVRDEEYQLWCYENGTSKAKVPSFHGIKAGLAFDFCKNVKGHEYDDLAFFDAAAAIAKQMGFDWGGDWKSFPDRPHLQWSDGGKFTNAMVRAGKYPPDMPLYEEPKQEEEEPELTQEEFDRLLENYLARDRAKAASQWAVTAWQSAKAAGVLDGTAPQAPLTREQAALVLERLGLLKEEKDAAAAG